MKKKKPCISKKVKIMLYKILGGLLYVPAPFLLLIYFVLVIMSIVIANTFTLFIG